MQKVAAVSGGLLGLLLVAGIIAFLWLGEDEEGQTNLGRTLEVKELANKSILESQAVRAVKAHESTSGALPGAIEDIDGLPSLPPDWEWEYDAAKGAIRIVAVPEGE